MVKMQHITTSTLTPLTILAASYDCNAYGSGTYNTTNCETATSPNPTTGGLADTGYNVIIPVAFGLALIIAAAILLIKQLKRRRSVSSTK